MIKPFIHLRTLSSYSLSESALKIEDIVNLAKQNDMPAIALTDNNNMFGALEFAITCSENGIQPIIGASINLLDVNYNNKVSQITFLANQHPSPAEPQKQSPHLWRRQLKPYLEPRNALSSKKLPQSIPTPLLQY